MTETTIVISRLKELLGVSKDKDLAMLIGLSPQDFSNRKKRGSLIEPIVKWGINENVDFNWLLTGKERWSKKKINGTSSQNPENNLMPIVERRVIPQNQREGIISNFNDKEMARQMILDLIEIEKLDHDHFMMMAGEIRGIARALKPKKMA